MASWLKIPRASPFSIENIPFGIISTPKIATRRPAIAIGEHALDLAALAEGGGFQSLPHEVQQHLHVFRQTNLNPFAALGRPLHRSIRAYIRDLLLEDTRFPAALRDNTKLREEALVPLSEVTTHLPLSIGDYTDFYAGLNHAFNVGVLFRGADNALQPNYKHIPVGYHGRASSVVVSGTPIRRPRGQILADPTAAKKTPIFSACRKLDYELELAAFVCRPNALGEPVPISEAEEHIFGYVLMNDWSARDIQAWEYVPLGPFNGKNFGTSISPWVVLADALEPHRTENLLAGKEGGEDGGAGLLPYLRNGKAKAGHDIRLTVEIAPKGGDGARHVVSNSNARFLLFSMDQMIAHHTVGGCNMNVGDLLGSGTISGPDGAATGSLLEISENGKKSITLGGQQRTFIEDDDEVIMTGTAGEEGSYVGFGECRGIILPALEAGTS